MTRLFCERRQVLQRVRSKEPPGARALYVRRDSEAGAVVFGTGTYMNIFHQSRWRRLSSLSGFALEMAASAPGRVKVLGVAGTGAPVSLAARRLGPGEGRVVFQLPPSADFVWFDWLPDDSAASLPEAAYTAEARPERPGVNLALVVTTFERHDDLRRLVDIYMNARAESEEIAAAVSLYIVNNQPRDAQALADLAQPGLTLINNPANTGGAGGFSRGARAAVEAGTFTHVAFMDDDIIIDSETWFRTLALLRNLAPGYAGQLLSGAMFLREKPAYCHTMSEAIDSRGYYLNVSGQAALDSLGATLEILADSGPGGLRRPAEAPAARRPYAAWWYCVLPVDCFKSFGYPLPVLFRGDDQEYGLRVGRKILTLNGICVWHTDFKNKNSDLRNYLEARNHAIFVTLHFRRWRWALLSIFAYRLANFLAANDYSSAAVVIQALRDYRNFHQRREGSVPEAETKLQVCRALFPNDLADAARVGAPRSITGLSRKKALDVIGVLAALGGSLIPGAFFRTAPVMASLSQIDGKFPARYVAYPSSPGIKTFNRRRAFLLSLKGLAALAGFFLPGRLFSKLKGFAATYGGGR